MTANLVSAVALPVLARWIIAMLISAQAILRLYLHLATVQLTFAEDPLQVPSVPLARLRLTSVAETLEMTLVVVLVRLTSAEELSETALMLHRARLTSAEEALEMILLPTSAARLTLVEAKSEMIFKLKTTAWLISVVVK